MSDDSGEFQAYTSVKSIARLAAKAAEDLRSQGYDLCPVV
jgi:hypothetical protein